MMISKSRFFPSILFIFLTAFLISCRQPISAKKITTEVIEGVTVVHNPNDPVYGEFIFDLQKDLVLGGDYQDDNNYFPRLGNAAVDDQGNIYVADPGNSRIQKYDNAGKFLLTIGRLGQGPGEFQFPSWVSWDEEGILWVYDSDRKIKAFTPAGIYLKSLMVTNSISHIHISVMGIHSSIKSLFPMEMEKQLE